MNIKSTILLRARLAFLAVLLFAVLVIVKIVKIQQADGKKWRNAAAEATLKYRSTDAVRGNIYAADGSLLATSLPFYRPAFDPTVASDEVFNAGVDSLALLLSDKFKNRTYQEYRKRIKNARKNRDRYVLISSKPIDYQQKKEMSTWPIFREGRARGGVIFEQINKRHLPFPGLATRTIGFINENNRGAGLEYSFNKFLNGKDGQTLYKKVTGGWEPVPDASEISPTNGYDIHTTIDVNIQDVAQASLMRALKTHNADYGCVALMEVKTGKIKAIVNLTRTESGGYYEAYNYLVGDHGLTDPGSTFKLASMAALLEDSDLQPTDSVNTGNGVRKFAAQYMRDVKIGGYGTISVQQAFEKSSNVGISVLTDRHFGSKPDKYVDYIKKFGLAEPIGFQMIGEAKPYVKRPSDKTWSRTSLPWISVGYELKISPLHLLAFYNAIANNGRLVRPMIVNRVTHADDIIESYDTETISDKICAEKTINTLKKMLEGVVERGTAKNIRTDRYKIAGKTGTAQKIINGVYTKNYYTSFAGYFPAEQPKYSCIVVIDNPRGTSRYGGSVSAPVFREIADKIFAVDTEMHNELKAANFGDDTTSIPNIRPGLKKDLTLICNTLGISGHGDHFSDWTEGKGSRRSVKWEPVEIVGNKIPDVKGMTLRDALYILESRGLEVSFKGTGRVVRQSLIPGTVLEKGKKIIIELT